MSRGALYATARALADHGENFGWSPYYKGNRIPSATLKKMAKRDDSVLDWYEAFRAALAQYEQATGGPWRY
jgi:hypothetical protein